MTKPQHQPVTDPGPFGTGPYPRRLMTAVEVADGLHLSKKAVYVLIERQELASYRLGNRIRVSTAQLDRYLASCLEDD